MAMSKKHQMTISVLRSLLARRAPDAIEKIVQTMQSTQDDELRVKCAEIILDRVGVLCPPSVEQIDPSMIEMGGEPLDVDSMTDEEVAMLVSDMSSH